MIDELNREIYDSNIKRVKTLLTEINDLNQISSIGNYPLIVAINSDDPIIVNMLLDAGADVNIENGLALFVAIDYCLDVMNLQGLNSPTNDCTAMVKNLIEKGANITLCDENYRLLNLIKEYSKNLENFTHILFKLNVNIT